MPARWAAAAASCAALSAASEVVESNLEDYNAPAFSTEDVTFSFIFRCLGGSDAKFQDCWHHSTGGTWRQADHTMAAAQGGMQGEATYSGFNRDYFRRSLASAVAWHSAGIHAAPFQANTFSSIKLDRVVEQTGAESSEFTSYNGHWNVMARVTVTDVPSDLAHDFMPVITRMFGSNVGSYGPSPGYSPDKAIMHWDSVWISNQAYFLDDKLEPVVGRGHKGQRLLIPLLLGITAMLLVPMMAVACTVSQQESVKAAEKVFQKEDGKYERVARDVQEKESVVDQHKKQEKEQQDAEKKAAAARAEAHAQELEWQDIDWLNGPGPPPAPAQPPAKPKKPADEGLMANLSPRYPAGKTADPVVRVQRWWRRRHTRGGKAQTEWHKAYRAVLEAEKRRLHSLRDKKIGSIHLKALKESRNGCTVQECSDAPDGSMGAAAQGGLREGDILIMVEYEPFREERSGVVGKRQTAEPLFDWASLRYAIGPAKEVFEGDRLTFTFVRSDRQKQLWYKICDSLPLTDAQELTESVRAHSNPMLLQQSSEQQHAMMGFEAEQLSRDRLARTQQRIKRLKEEQQKLMQEGGVMSAGSIIGVQKKKIIVGEDTPGARSGRIRQWEKVRGCEVLCCGDMSTDSVDSFLSNPSACHDVAKEAFEKADRDSSGSLDVKEITRLLSTLSREFGFPEITTRYAERIFKEIDTDGSGEISFEEFFPFFRRTIIRIVVELEKEMQFHGQGLWTPPPLKSDSVEHLKEMIEKEVHEVIEKQGGDGPWEITMEYNVNFAMTWTVRTVRLPETAHTPITLYKSDAVSNDAPGHENSGYEVAHHWKHKQERSPRHGGSRASNVVPRD